MKKSLVNIILLCLFHSSALYAQRENVWAFGGKGGVDFNSGSPISIHTSSDGFGEGCATVCDKKGQLLFYTEGSLVWDRSGNVMPNGDTLITDPLVRAKRIAGITPTSSTSQGALIVPMPDSPNKYYVFSQTSTEFAGLSGRVYYSVVDMVLNSGLGDVESARRSILIDSENTEKMTAVTGMHCDVWLLTCAKSGNVKAFEITNSGINTTPVVSYVGFLSISGGMKISPNGKKLIACNLLFPNANLFDFDPVTGTVSNNIKLPANNTYGGDFSPDNSKVYISGDSIYQFDISSGVAKTIASSRVTLGIGGLFSDLKLAIDGKIYFGTGYGLGSISYPNVSGIACGCTSNGVILDSGTSAGSGLPNAIAEVIKDTVYSSNKVHVCFSDSTVLHVDTPGWDYVWEDGSGLFRHTIYNSGTYLVKYITPPCIHHTDTFIVVFASKAPQVSSFSGCKGANNAYAWVQPHSGDTGAFTYTWRDAANKVIQTHVRINNGDTLYGAVVGTYSIRISVNGCDTTLSINVFPPYYRTSFLSDTIACVNNAIKFINTSTGLNQFAWDFGDGTTSIEDSPGHAYNLPGRYKVSLVGLPCNDTFVRMVRVDSLGYITFSEDKRVACVGQNITFIPFFHGNPAEQLRWSFSDGSIENSTANVSHAWDSSGKKIVKLTALYAACPSVSYTDSIAVYSYPVVYLGVDTSLCPGDAAISLSNKSANINATDLWNTGAISSSINVIDPGIYWLEVTSDEGCSTTDSIAVNPNCYVAIPNAFTPDGDGVNDYFFPRQLLSRGITNFHMSIYDRWGEEIFATQNINGRGWDGKFNGVKQSTGVYIYVIDVTFKNGYRQSYKGNVTLVAPGL